jgi:hypothetical protein
LVIFLIRNDVQSFSLKFNEKFRGLSYQIL